MAVSHPAGSRFFQSSLPMTGSARLEILHVECSTSKIKPLGGNAQNSMVRSVGTNGPLGLPFYFEMSFKTRSGGGNAKVLEWTGIRPVADGTVTQRLSRNDATSKKLYCLFPTIEGTLPRRLRRFHAVIQMQAVKHEWYS
jgi:hypothetical protein